MRPDGELALGKRVRALYGHSRAVKCEGVIIAIANFPTFVIQTDSGEKVHWACDLTEEAPAPALVPYWSVGDVILEEFEEGSGTHVWKRYSENWVSQSRPFPRRDEDMNDLLRLDFAPNTGITFTVVRRKLADS